MKPIRVVLGLAALLSLGVLAAETQAQSTPAKVMSKPGTVIEAETLLPRAHASAGEISAQNMQGFGPQWGHGSQLFWRAPAPVDTPIRNWPNLTLPLDVPRDGRYTVTIFFTAAPDFGNVRVFLRGKAVGDYAGYATGVSLKAFSLGEQELKAGSNQLILTVFGKEAGSGNYFVGIDRFVVAPVAVAPAAAAASAVLVARTSEPRQRRVSLARSMSASLPPEALVAATLPTPPTLSPPVKSKLLSSAGSTSFVPGQTITLSPRQTYISMAGPDGDDFAELVLVDCTFFLPELPMAGCNSGTKYQPGSAGAFLPFRAPGKPVLVEFALYEVKPGVNYRISWQAAEATDSGTVTFSPSSQSDSVYGLIKPMTSGYYRIWLEVDGATSFQLNRIEITVSQAE